ncbi:NAD(P)-binding protein [Lophiostoma macrostomum CBS 122681]|uniref:NAD(P)-binding protein n=1 Tax=Lophiostoma macrostomum CBS 122681 TaxID=1314788 RepID=A0A6A6T900_9PLEO|nr:NAD(P)-binding protein [Lophiostoma macrostomum CBS 122681]
MAATLTANPASDSNKQPFSAEGKSAIVTGAGSGINLSFASLLLHRGCSVLFADLALRPEAQRLVDQYAKKRDGRPRAVFVKTDVREWVQLERMFQVAVREFGGVDVVCPGAGIYDPHWSNFWHPPGSPQSRDPSKSNRYASLDINVTHPIRTAQLAISHFLNASPPVSRTNPKRIIIISSIAGQMSNLNTPIYVAGKHAMNGFIRSLATLDAEFGVRVNGVAPGVIKTPLWTEHPEKMTFLNESQDEWATPEEVAEAMVRYSGPSLLPSLVLGPRSSVCSHYTDEPELGGGTILEVGAKQTRLVEQLNDPGPSGPGHTVSHLQESYKEVFGWLKEKDWGKSKL